MLDGPQRDWFEGDVLFTREYAISPASNRMGLRLKGEPLARRPGELVSEAVAPGAVQVTNDGLPVVLGVDGQTIGGYPKIAHVIRADLDRLAQLRPGDSVRFQRVTPEEAERAARRASLVPEGMAHPPPHRRSATHIPLILCHIPDSLSSRVNRGGNRMKNGIIVGLLTACIGVSLYLVKAEKPAANPEAAPSIANATPSAPPAPVVLTEVVEVIDLDALLDTPPKRVTGEPFDTPSTSSPISIPSAPDRIPPAMD